MIRADEFEVLNSLRKANGFDMASLSVALKWSLTKTRTLVREFRQRGWVDAELRLTARGRRALGPYKVDNAIIMAAGVSRRFAPLSYVYPKGLLEVKGEVLIERQIRQLQEAGISDITVVVGYMKERFGYLEGKMCVKVVENPDYARWNNTSTLIRVLPKLKNTYICSSDNYFTENVFEPYVYRAYYAATFYPGPASEWGLRFDRKGVITGVDHHPVDMWCMMGHAYWSRAFSRTFKKILKAEFKCDSVKGELWEAVFERHVRELTMAVRPYPAGAVLEFDTVRDIGEFDSAFRRRFGSVISLAQADFKRAETLMSGLFKAKIVLFERLGGLTNRSYKTTLDNGKIVVVRLPGEGTEAIISRKSERISTELACRCGVDVPLRHFGDDGIKVMDYIDRATTMNARLLRRPENVRAVAGIFRTLHDTGVDTKVPFNVFQMARQYQEVIAANGVQLYADFPAITKRVAEIKRSVDAECDVRIVPCHNDALCENWIKDGRGRMYLIDWEYAGMNDAMWDLADTSVEAGYSSKTDRMLLRAYFGRLPTLREEKNFMANKIYLDFLWTLWGKTRVPFDGQEMEDYADARYARLKTNLSAYDETFTKSGDKK